MPGRPRSRNPGRRSARRSGAIRKRWSRSTGSYRRKSLPTRARIAGDAAPARGDIVAEFLAEDDLAHAPSVRVLSGVNAGRTIALMKDGMSLGRAGVQVAVVRRSPHGARLVPLEGERAPIVNDAEVPVEGTELRNGDVVEIAGVKLEFVSARARS